LDRGFVRRYQGDVGRGNDRVGETLPIDYVETPVESQLHRGGFRPVTPPITPA